MVLGIVYSDFFELLAMVHPKVQGGDKIYYLRGCTIPVALRPVLGPNGEKNYRVIGGVYLTVTEGLNNWMRVNTHNEEADPNIGISKFYQEWVKGEYKRDFNGLNEEVLALC